MSGGENGINIAGPGATSFSQTNDCGASLAGGASCTVTVEFAPKSMTEFGATLNVMDNAFGSPQIVTLDGVGSSGVLNFLQIGEEFTGTAVGYDSLPELFTMANNGDAILTFKSISISGPNATSFSETNNCGKTLKPGDSCSLNLTFEPKALGWLDAFLEISDNSFTDPNEEISIRGLGTNSSVLLSPTSLNFRSEPVGTAAPGQKVRLTAQGTEDVLLRGPGLGIHVINNSAPSFRQANDCGSIAKAGTSCTITVTFDPKVPFVQIGTLSVAANAPNSPQQVALSGMGLGPVVTVLQDLVFPSTAVGSAAPAREVDLSNEGNRPLILSGGSYGFTLSGPDASSFSQTNTCSSGVAPQHFCKIFVTFQPKASGKLTAILSISDNASPSTQVVKLFGTGTQ